jgi:glucose/arabinose dehydrogenase
MKKETGEPPSPSPDDGLPAGRPARICLPAMTRSTIRTAALALAWVATSSLALSPARAADDLPRIKLEKVVKLDKPVEVRADPAGRLFAVEQTGRALLLEGGKPAAAPYLDLSDKVYVAFECGLLGLTFHPKFAENGLLYASYTINTAAEGGKNAKVVSYVSEFRAGPKATTVDVKTERVLLTLNQPYENHNGGQVQFGPDGMLYVGFGDGGSGHDPHNNGQNPDVWFGKILRIDPTPTPDGAGRDGTPHAFPGAAYTVPADNPFVGRPGWKPEIWALGQRNPWRFSFDRQTGLLYVGDVGQDVWEEVNVVTKGGNYGWRVREGKADLHPAEPTTTPLIDPIFQYNHDKKAASITGGYVYRGSKILALRGWYLCADYSLGTFYGVRYEGGKVTGSGVLVDPLSAGRTAGQRPTQPSGFGEDKDGELYVTDINGWMYKVVPAE